MLDEAQDRSYVTHVARLKQTLDKDQALRKAIGGEFLAVGALERFLLLSLGLKPSSSVVDIGCGSGRLASQLAAMRDVKYLGTDVVPELLEYAKQLTQRPDWKFLLAQNTRIPCENESADFVCFFSVFTHLSHEETYRYLGEAKRVLKPGGKIVFSFLEFRVPCHWIIFEDSVNESLKGLHVNQFMDRDGIRAWAANLGLRVISLMRGDHPHIPISEDIAWENGNVMKGFGNLGQSVAVLGLASDADPADRATQFGGGDAGAQTPTEVAAQAAPIGRGFTNISTRGFVGTGDNAMIVGFIIPPGGRKVLVRAQGEALKKAGIDNPLKEPWIEVMYPNGLVLASNFGFYRASESEREDVLSASRAIHAAPPAENDAALVADLNEGIYTVLVRGQDGGTGVVLAEVFAIDQRV